MPFNYPRFYYEWDVPPAGIDTISIWIHPYLINKHSFFHEKGNANEAINLRIKREIDPLTKKTIRVNYLLDVQAEAINPYENIFHQVIQYIVSLFKSGILKICYYIPDEYSFFMFLMNNFNSLFSLDFVDFYFDIQEEDAKLLGKVDVRFPNTQYCIDNSIKTYNRIICLKHKNTIPHQYIDKMLNPRRIEFHLTRITCRYLHCCNLNGNFDVVFINYLSYLARKWRKYKRQIIDIPNINESNYHYLKQIDSLAFSRTIPHTKSLAKSPPKPVPFKKAKKNEADYDWFPIFVSGNRLPENQC